MADEPETRDTRPDVHYETKDANVRAVIGFGVGLLVVALLIHLGVWVLYAFFAARESHLAPTQFPIAAGGGDRLPPEPRLQTAPREDLRRFRAEEDRILDSYGWVDQSAGVVRIPIRRAMELTLQRGLPSRPANGHDAGHEASTTNPAADAGRER